ncbi:hypothetical protein TRVA0_018S00144 [Trichomonascus vanleenenianus]|uniref:uncharacterized protein n=1 Tax=Trichomonascus vanleenenianus TaxID=2268995 RepID=UPI003ECB1723
MHFTGIQSLVGLILSRRPEELFPALHQDGAIDVRHFVRAVCYLYAFVPSGPSHDALIALLPSIVEEAARTPDESPRVLMQWHLALFAVVRQNPIDRRLFRTEKFVSNGGFENAAVERNSLSRLCTQDQTGRLQQIARSMADEVYRTDPATYATSAKLLYIVTNSIFLDVSYRDDRDSLLKLLRSIWHTYRSMWAHFKAHPTITEPVLLGALIYSAVTKKTFPGGPVRDSADFKKRFPALHDVYYLVMRCARVDAGSAPQLDVFRDVEDLTRNRVPREGSPSPDLVIADFRRINPQLALNNGEISPRNLTWSVSDIQCHVCCHRNFFDKFTTATKQLSVSLWGRRRTVTALGVGTVRAALWDKGSSTTVTLILTDVYYVPLPGVNVISLPRLGASVYFDAGSINLMLDAKTGVDPPIRNLTLPVARQGQYCLLDRSRKEKSYTLPSNAMVRFISTVTA